MRQHSCLREETSTDVIYCWDHVPNSACIIEHWSVVTVYRQLWLEETWKRHDWIWVKAIQPSLPRCDVKLNTSTEPFKTDTGELKKKIMWIYFYHQTSYRWTVIPPPLLMNSGVVTANCGCRIQNPMTFNGEGTSVEKTTHYKARQDISSSKLSPWRARKHTNLVPRIQYVNHRTGDKYTKKLPFLQLRGFFRYCIERGSFLHHLAHTDIRHNTRKEIQLQSCAITLTSSVKVSKVPVLKLSNRRRNPQR